MLRSPSGTPGRFGYTEWGFASLRFLPSAPFVLPRHEFMTGPEMPRRRQHEQVPSGGQCESLPDKSGFYGHADGLRGVASLQFVQHVSPVNLDRSRADRQVLSNEPVR